MGTQPKSRSRTQLRQGAAPLLGTVPAIVSARQFWTIVLASLLLGGTNSANADDTEETGLPKNADQTPEEQEPSAQATNIDTESAEDNLNGQQTDKTESNKDTFSASTPSSDSSSAIPLSDERLAAMVRQWLGLKQDYQSTQLLAASLGTTPSAVAPKVESAEEARQAFRDLFNEEIQRQGGVLLSDADGVEKTKSDFDFNPTYLLGLLGLAGGGGGGGGACRVGGEYRDDEQPLRAVLPCGLCGEQGGRAASHQGPGLRVGKAPDPRQRHLPRLYRHGNGACD